jgi:hypothetical protein
MPPTPRHALRRRLTPLLVAGVLCLLAIGAGLAMLKPDKPPAEQAVPRSIPTVAAPLAAPPTTARASTAGVAAPPLLDAERWAQLQQALAGHPQPDAETARILDLLTFQRTVQQFRSERQSHPGGSTPTLLTLAREIDAGLDTRLARGEVSGPEAQHIKAGLLEVLQPDASRRAGELAAWRDAQLAARPPRADPRDVRLQQEQQALVARWRREAPAGAAPDALVAQLEALRQRIYASPSTHQGHTP